MTVAIITGGSRGLGRALAEGLVQDGWRVIVDARHLVDLPVGVIGVEGDVADSDHRAALMAAADSLGRLDLLVNNASVLGPSPLLPLAQLPLEAFAEVFRVNVASPLGLIQLALPRLRSTGGAIVNITSDAAVEGYSGWGVYGSSKAALDQLGNVLGAEEPGVRVWSFDPGDMRTQMHQDAFPGEDISDRPNPETVLPALRRLLADRPASGRIKAGDLLGVAAP